MFSLEPREKSFICIIIIIIIILIV